MRPPCVRRPRPGEALPHARNRPTPRSSRSSASCSPPRGGRFLPRRSSSPRASPAPAGRRRACFSIARVHGTAFGFPSPGLLPTKREWQEQRDLVAPRRQGAAQTGPRGDGEVVGTRKAAARICQQAKSLGCDVIVMAADPPRNRVAADFLWSQEPYRVRGGATYRYTSCPGPRRRLSATAPCGRKRRSASGRARRRGTPRAARGVRPAPARSGSTMLSTLRPRRPRSASRGGEAHARDDLERLAQPAASPASIAPDSRGRRQPVDGRRDRDPIAPIAWKRARLTIGVTPRRLMSSVPSVVRRERAGEAQRRPGSAAVRASWRRNAGCAGASRITAISGGTISSPPLPWRKSNETVARIRCELSGSVRQSRKTLTHADCAHPPRRVAREHAVEVREEAAALEPRVDALREALEVAVDAGSPSPSA